ncbi:MAG TPA: hypothetical protein VG319_05640, partial [Polyangia bacterium]|nr:hypothetical protein [Polyangia bacterium]
MLDLREAEANRHDVALCEAAPRERLLQKAGEVAPALGLGIEAIQGLTRLARAVAGRRELDDALVGRDGVVRPPERRLGELSKLGAQALLGGGVAR